jgi:TolA-binding protein
MKKSYYLAAVVLGILLTTAAVSLTTLAATTATTTQTNSNTNNTPQSKFNAEHQAVNQAIQNNDYTAWQTAMEAKVTAMRQQADKLESTINQDTFNKIVQAYQLIKEGKTDEAKAIFEELDMPGIGPMGKGMGLMPPGQGHFGPRPDKSDKSDS